MIFYDILTYVVYDTSKVCHIQHQKQSNAGTFSHPLLHMYGTCAHLSFALLCCPPGPLSPCPRKLEVGTWMAEYRKQRGTSKVYTLLLVSH